MGTTVSTEVMAADERRGRQGRRYVSVERRRELLAAFSRSSLTRTEFARREGIKYTTLCNWVQQEGAASESAEPRPQVRFAEVAWPANVGPGLEIRLADGTVLRGGRIEDLAALARALRS